MDMTDGIIRRKIKKCGKGISVDLTCEFCGKPITSSGTFGMDCENRCQEKRYNKLTAKNRK